MNNGNMGREHDDLVRGICACGLTADCVSKIASILNTVLYRNRIFAPLANGCLLPHGLRALLSLPSFSFLLSLSFSHSPLLLFHLQRSPITHTTYQL